MRVDLNSDLGESFGRYRLGMDSEVMRYITSANVACGWHAGDPLIMRKTVRLAKEYGVSVGAHPGYPDLMGFGRRYMDLSHEEARNYVLYQIGSLYAFLRAENMPIQHVKPHGALYNAMLRDDNLARAVLEGIADFDRNLIFVGLANSKVIEMGREMGLRVANEVFADRAYNSDGTLVSRRVRGAVLTDKEVIGERIISMVKDGGVRSIDGDWVELDVDTVCIHGDNDHALEIAKYVRALLEREGVELMPLGNFIR